MSSSRDYTEVVTLGSTTFYRVVGSPNGALLALQGSVAIRTDTAQVWLNNSAGPGPGTSWIQLSMGGAGTELLPPNVVNGPISLNASPSNNICYDLSSQTFTQTLPQISSSVYNTFRVVLHENGAFSTITFAPSGGDTIVGSNQLQTSLVDDGIFIHDGVSTWCFFGVM